MSDLYTEVMVAKKPTVKDQLIKFVLILFTVLFALAGLVLMPILLVAAVILGVVDYVFIPRLSVEFEYLYVNGELDVGRIFSKSRRKRAASYDLSSMEIMAPWNSHRLDSYKNNRGLKKVDYSSGIEGEGHKPYGFVISNKNQLELVIFEPNEVMLKDIRSKMPRKVFYD